MSNAADTEIPISSRLARRLAAAADGYQNGKMVWFTALAEPDEEGNFQISEAIVSDTRPADPVDPKRRVYGPFLSEREGPARSTPIVKITLHVQEGGQVRQVEFPADKYDALFWSTSALDKFAVPHYVAFEGLPQATEMRAEYVDHSAVFAIVHGPNTEYDRVQLKEPGGANAAPAFLLSI